jgi:hypothetical protein
MTYLDWVTVILLLVLVSTVNHDSESHGTLDHVSPNGRWGGQISTGFANTVILTSQTSGTHASDWGPSTCRTRSLCLHPAVVLSDTEFRFVAFSKCQISISRYITIWRSDGQCVELSSPMSMWSYLTTDGQPTSMSWYEASIWGPRPIFLSWKSFIGLYFVYGVSSLTRGWVHNLTLLLDLTCAVFLGCYSSLTRDNPHVRPVSLYIASTWTA